MNDDTMLWTRFRPSRLAEPRADRESYVFFDEDLVSKVNIAITIRRPLLLTGNPGLGKSRVAAGVADAKAWNLIETTVSSRLDAEALKFKFDALGRLNDAQVGAARPPLDYLEPGPIWRAYDPISALDQMRRFLRVEDDESPALAPYLDARDAEGRVLLIDEIDKGEIDFSNDLLDVFDLAEFRVPYRESPVRRTSGDLLVVITSNGEKDLSRPFLRRVLQHEVAAPLVSTCATEIGAVLQSVADRKRDGEAWPWLDARQLVAVADKLARDGRFNIAEYADAINALRGALARPVDGADFDRLLNLVAQIMEERRASIERTAG